MWAGHLLGSSTASPDPHLLPRLPRLHLRGPPTGPPTIARDPAVLLALLLRVELVAVALAAPVDEGDALPLGSVKCPELVVASAGAGDDGETAGRYEAGGRCRV